MGWYDRKLWRGDLSCGDTRYFLEVEVRRLDCRHRGKVKRERLDFLADNPFYTQRFAYYVGRRCRSATIKDVAAELKLDWHTVKALDQQYMEAQLKRANFTQVIGIDEIAIRKGHTYRIVVSHLAGLADLVWRQGPFGGKHGSSRQAWQDEERAHSGGGDGHVEAVSWRRRRMRRRPRFCSTSSMSCGIWARLWIRSQERIWAASGRDRRYIKGQKYTLLSRKENLTLDGRKALKTLLSANKRLNTAYVLKESFGQLWSYEREAGRGVFQNWRQASSGSGSSPMRSLPR